MQRVLRKLVQLVQNFAQSWEQPAHSGLHITIVGLLAFALFTAWVPTTFGHLPVLKVWEQQLQQPSHEVKRLGNLETAPVIFDGAPLFTLASPTVWDRSQPGNQLPVEIRSQQVEANLNRVIEGSFVHGNKDGILTNFDPQTLQVSVISLNDVPVIIAGDGYHSQPLKLVTVTHVDAEYNGQPVAALAEQWRSLIYQSLYAALMERSPEALSLHGKLGESLIVLAIMLGASVVLWLLQVPLKRRNRRLRLQQAAVAAEIYPEPSRGMTEFDLIALRARFLDSFQHQKTLQQQRRVVGFFRWLLAWAQVLVWTVGLILALTAFPWTRQYVRQFLGTPTTLLLIWFFTSLVSRLGSGLLQLLADAWVKFGAAAADDPQRDVLRISTILASIKPVKTVVVYGIGIIAALVYLGLPLSLVLTLAGIVGLALLLICQNFVRDGLMGCLILWEDQYAIGDVISTGQHTGLVERMNLRLTQLRHAGGLVSLANSSIAQVTNLTQSWQQRQEALHPKAIGPRATANGIANPFNGTDPFNGMDPFGGSDSGEPTASEG
ncbi:MAG: mechanosensitive ion channel [Elainella sp. C42_A2020_010]|nr:mechanosensitive ion channel [Elainella sp. C42_A2020_010]